MLRNLIFSVFLALLLCKSGYAQQSVQPVYNTGGYSYQAVDNQGHGLPVVLPGGGGGTTASWNPINAVIAVTGTALQVQALATPNSGLSCFVVAAGSNSVSIGKNSSVTNPQSVSFSGGSAVGVYEVNGQGWSAAINNANLVYINGTAGDGVTCWGN